MKKCNGLYALLICDRIICTLRKISETLYCFLHISNNTVLYTAVLPISKNQEGAMPSMNNLLSLSSTRVFEAAEIGAVIRARRKELGYTQEYISSIMGLSPRLIGEIERGRKTVGIQKVMDLATGLGIDITVSVRGK